MFIIRRITLYALLMKMEKENIEWPISSTYPNVVAYKKTWDAFITTIADLMEAYRVPMSAFFRAIEEGDDCLESLSYDSPSFADGIIYERRGILDVMVDIWRERNDDSRCRAELRRKLDADGVKVNSWFASHNPNMTVYLLSMCCEALGLKISEVIGEYERRYIAEHNLKG